MAYGMKKEKGSAPKKSVAKKASAGKKAVAMTSAQKKLPPFIQKAIMSKKKSK